MNETPATDHLIDLCARGVVPVERWSDRDTPSSQAKLAAAGAYLRAGCPWRLSADPASNERTWWIEVQHPTFSSIEWRGMDEYDDAGEWELFYLPTEARLAQVAGKDWY